jgi:hypothetical protein
MFTKRKDAPELYEVLKKSNIDGNRTSDKTVENREEVIVKTAPVLQAKSSVTAVLPKLKSSFIRDQKHSAERKEWIITLNTAIFIGLLLVILLAAVFVIGIKVGEGKLNVTNPAPTKPDSATSEPVVNPIENNAGWAIRVVHYDNTTPGQKNANAMIKKLTDKGITKVFKTEERIQGRQQVCVYIGKYDSESEAKKTLAALKVKHKDINFKISSIVEK